MVYFKEIYPADLFLLGELISLGISGLLGPDSVQALEGASLANGLEGLELLQVVGHLHGTSPLDDWLDGHDCSGQLNSLGKLLSGGISLAWLLGVQGEQDQLGLVLLQALGVQLEGLHALVPAAVINGDSNGLRVLLAQTSSLQLLKGEAPASPLLEVVLVGGAAHHGPELAQGPGGDAGSLLNPVLAAPDLPRRLVEPGLDIALPVLVEVTIGDDVIPLCWHCDFSCRSESSNISLG